MSYGDWLLFYKISEQLYSLQLVRCVGERIFQPPSLASTSTVAVNTKFTFRLRCTIVLRSDHSKKR